MTIRTVLLISWFLVFPLCFATTWGCSSGSDAGDDDTSGDDDTNAGDDDATVGDEATPTASPAAEGDYFDFKDQHYPLPTGSVFCSDEQGYYTVRGGALSDTTSLQANAYAYFKTGAPPAAGSYNMVPDIWAELSDTQVRVMVLDTSDYSFWWGQTGTVTVVGTGDDISVQFVDVVVANQLDLANTSPVEARMSCYQ